MVRQLADIGECFDTVLDCGLFHVFDGEDRTAYVDGLRSAPAPGGRCFVLRISDRERGARGLVHKVTPDDIEAAFAHGWQVDSIEPSAIELRVDPGRIAAWLVTLTRT